MTNIVYRIGLSYYKKNSDSYWILCYVLWVPHKCIINNRLMEGECTRINAIDNIVVTTLTKI